MKKKVLTIYPNASDSTSLWRGAGPMAMVEKMMPDIHFKELNTDLNWRTFWGYDVVFMQRPSTAAHKEACLLLKRMGIKLWLDFDDDLFNVPVSNPASLTYNQRDVQRDVTHIVTLADAITVSTPDLHRKYGQLNKNITVVPNAWNERLFHYRAEDKVARSKVVLWRGTRTHAEDLDRFLPELGRVAEDHKDWKFVFVGGAYWKVHHAIPEDQLVIYEGMEQTLFYEMIYKLGAKIMIVPLADHTFNKAKSNIAWQEGSFCGSAVLCPDWEEWIRPGAINYRDAKDFEGTLRTMMMPNGMDLSQPAKLSWDYISKYLTLDQANEIRCAILSDLLK
jgi:glycosyltransferase involved in cell wall biosynthesis